MHFEDNDINKYKQLIDDERSGFLYQNRFLFSEALIHFYLKIINDKNEYDLSRIEATKCISDHNREILSTTKLANAVVSTLVRIITDKQDDDDVRSYCAISLLAFCSFGQLSPLLETTMLDSGEDINLRACILDVIAQEKSSEHATHILNGLLNDSDFKKTAHRLLSEKTRPEGM